MEKHHWSREEVRQYRRERRSLVSYNPQDANLWVKKERGICAWTLNWGNPKGGAALFDGCGGGCAAGGGFAVKSCGPAGAGRSILPQKRPAAAGGAVQTAKTAEIQKKPA